MGLFTLLVTDWLTLCLDFGCFTGAYFGFLVVFIGIFAVGCWGFSCDFAWVFTLVYLMGFVVLVVWVLCLT